MDAAWECLGFSLHSNTAEGIRGTSRNCSAAKMAKVANVPATCISGPRCYIEGMEPPVSQTISRGAIASVLCTVIGAIALTAGFGVAISSAVVGVSPSGSLTADIKVSWAENEGGNSEESRRKAIKFVEDSDKYFFVIPISRAELGFDAIEENAEGWPPDLGTKYNNGLNSYTINITVKGAAGLLQTTSVCVIVRTNESDKFSLLVPGSGTLRDARANSTGFMESIYADALLRQSFLAKVKSSTEFKGKEYFDADAQGVVDLAAAEKRDGDR